MAPPRRLGGGRGASVWEIATPAGLRAVKVAARERTGRETCVLDAVAGLGVAPRLVAAGDGLLVTERIAGDARPATEWSVADARAVGTLLRRLHESGVTTAAVDDGIAAGAAARVTEPRVRADEQDCPLVARAIAMLPTTTTTTPPPPAVLLHGDPWSGNVVWGPDGPLLVDWEFARVGDPAEDLAYLAAMDMLSAPTLRAVFMGYGVDAATAGRAAAWRPFMALWCAGWFATVGETTRSARLKAHAARLVAGAATSGLGGAWT